MSKFKSKPALPELPNEGEIARFAAGAETKTAQADSSSTLPWEGRDKNARPLSGINLRLNDYEHELLRHLADLDRRSLQQTIKLLLIPAAEAAAAKLKKP